ncbi:MAG: ParB/RepB/Spo0J family partition protein [Oscillospiraceae bacterium]|nr:ParB/RepB/Spo0J family partition protein [Oscillospiraceae bacterium]
MKLQNIEISRIASNPLNPRKDLGDLTELSESIRTQGIMQNLTIIPKYPEKYSLMVESKRKYDGDYIAVIGHRRLAAAKLVGVETAPCVIVPFMLDNEQVAVMMSENNKRKTLTNFEEACGFQMMLDLGDTISDITEKTGSSKTTVYERIAPFKFLDKKAVEEAFERNATFEDFAKLNRIKDEKKRAELSESIGTSYFNWSCDSVFASQIKKEKWKQNKPQIIAKLEKMGITRKATYFPKTDGYVHYIDTVDSISKIDLNKESYFYYTDTDHIKILYDMKSTKEDAEKLAKKNELIIRNDEFDELWNFAYRMRLQFAQSFRPKREQFYLIYDKAADFLLFYSNTCDFDNEVFGELFNIKTDDRNVNIVHQKIRVQSEIESTMNPATKSFRAIYCLLEQKYSTVTPDCYEDEKEELEPLIELYEFMEKLGYEMSDEEKALLNGTHELYINDDEEA